MRHFGLRYVAGALALFAFLAVSGASHASCTGSNRISDSNSSCFDGSIDNHCNAWLFGGCLDYDSTSSATLKCELTGSQKVVVKFDLLGCNDENFTFTSERAVDYKKTYNFNFGTRRIYCCEDLGKCN